MTAPGAPLVKNTAVALADADAPFAAAPVGGGDYEVAFLADEEMQGQRDLTRKASKDSRDKQQSVLRVDDDDMDSSIEQSMLHYSSIVYGRSPPPPAARRPSPTPPARDRCNLIAR